MNYCFRKTAYLVWTGSNLSETEAYFAGNFYEGSTFALAVEGDNLHLNRFGQQFVLAPGGVMIGTWPEVATEEEFAENYGVVAG